MDTNKAIEKLIENAKSGEKKYSSFDAADKHTQSINSYATLKHPDDIASRCGVKIAHLEHTIMSLLNEINLQSREVKHKNELLELYKETLKG